MITNGRVSNAPSNVGPTPGSTPSSEDGIRRLGDGLQEENSAIRSSIMAQMKVMRELGALKRRLNQKQQVLLQSNAALKQVYARERSLSQKGRGGARSKTRHVPHVPGVEENVSTSLEQRAHELIAHVESLLLHGEHMQQDQDWAARLAAVSDPPLAQENSFSAAGGATRHPAVREPGLLQESSGTAPDEASVPVSQWHGLLSTTAPTSSAASSSWRLEAGRPSEASVPASHLHDLQSSALPMSSAASASSWRPGVGASSEGIVARMALAPEYAAGADDLFTAFIEL